MKKKEEHQDFHQPRQKRNLTSQIILKLLIISYILQLLFINWKVRSKSNTIIRIICWRFSSTKRKNTSILLILARALANK